MRVATGAPDSLLGSASRRFGMETAASGRKERLCTWGAGTEVYRYSVYAEQRNGRGGGGFAQGNYREVAAD